jgi:transcriptional regulator with XRE-family HTH domain
MQFIKFGLLTNNGFHCTRTLLAFTPMDTIFGHYQTFQMELGECIKKMREAKGLSQKEVALACKIDTANYSRIESGKTDPAFSSVIKIAKAMDVELLDLFKADQTFRDINSFDKSLAEKLSFIEGLDKKDKIAFYAVLDAFIGKKKLKDALSNVLSDVK